MSDDALDMRMHLLHEARDESFAAGQAVERARCIKVLEDMRVRQMDNEFTYWYLVALDDALDALKANASSNETKETL